MNTKINQENKENQALRQNAKAQNTNLFAQGEYIKINADGTREHGSEMMLVENAVEVVVNGKLAGKIPCTPENLPELVVGWCYSEGIIDSIEQIENLEITESANILVAQLSKSVALGTPEVEASKSAETTAAQASEPASINVAEVPDLTVAQASGTTETTEPKVPEFELDSAWIFALMKDFEVELPLRTKTEAAHNCRLARGNADGSIDVLVRLEDIGRHTAIDKVVGWALMNRIDVSDCILFTSGRISWAMAHKVAKAGIPIMAGKGAVSKTAVDLARANGMTIIGHAKSGRFCIFK